MQGGDAGNSLVNDSATAANLTLNIAAGPYSYAGVLGGSTANQQNFSLAKTGAGTITFAGAATHSGATTVNNGTLNFNAAATLPGSVAVSGSGNLNFNGTAALTGPVSISAGSLGLGANATVKTLTATGGTVTGYKGVGAGSSTGSTLTVSGGTTSVTTASGATVATVDLTAGTGTLNALANPLAVTNSLSLAGGASITGNFTVQGGNVADNAVARTVTVTDGAITLISPATMRIIAVKDAPVPTPWLGTVAAVSQPFTVTGGNVIVVAVQTRGALNAAPATITWGSTTLNRAVIAQTTGETRETSIYYGLNPAPGTNNIAGTFAGATFTAIDAFTLSGVDPATVKYAGIGSNATNQPVQTVMIPGVAANSFGFGLACDNADTTLGTNNSCTGFSITSPGSTSTSAFWYAGNQPTNNTAVGGTFLQNMPAGDTLITDTVLSTGAVNNALRSNFAAIVFGPAGSAGPGAMASTTLSVAGPTVTVNLASGGAPSVGALAFTPAAAGGTMTLPTPGASITFGGTSFQGPGTYTVHATSTVTPGPLDDGGSAVTLGKAGPGKMVLNAAPAAFGVSSSVALSGASPGTLGIVGSSSLDPLGSGGAEVLLGSTGGVIQFSSTAGAAVFDNPLAFHDSAAVMAGAYDGGAAGLAVTLGGAYGLSVDSAKTVTLGTANSYTLNLAGPITGAGNPNKGLLSLTRVAGAGSITAGGQIVLAEDAIVAHSDFSNDNNNGKAGYTIANLGATPDLYFGLYNDFNAGSSQRLDIGAGTPWKGVSSAMEGQKRFYQGTLNVNPGTTDFYLQGISTLGGGTVNLYLGNTTTTGMTIAVGGPATAHVLGSVLLDSDRSTFSSDLTFRVEPGATLTLNQAKAMGGSNAAIAATTSPVIAGVGGRVSLGNAAAVNGPLTVEGGGVLFNNNMGALTGTGTITFQPGGIYDINNVNALSGAQTIVRVPGMIYRINAGDNPTIPNLNLNTAASAAGIYELYNNNDNNENYTPTAPTTWQPNVWLDGGVITHDAQARSWYSTRNGYMAIGPAGAAFAGTTAPGWSGYPALRVDEDFDLGANTLTIGSTDSIDGLPKYGPVELRSAGNRATAGSKIVVLGNGAAGAYLRLRYDPNTNQGTRTWGDVIPNQSRLEIQAGATFDTYATIDVIGSIVGGGIIRNSADQVQPMFVGSDGTDAVFSGAFQAANQGLQIIKVGGGNWTLTGDSSAWTNNALAVASGTVTLKDSGKVKFGTLTNQYFGVTNVYQGATLTFDETGSVNGADRLAGQHLQMDGGALVLKGSTTADTTDALAGQLLLRWDSEVIDIQPSAGRTATLSFTNATASTISWGATGLIKGRNLGDGTGAMLKFNAPPAYTGQTATSGANKAIWPALLASPNTDGSSPMFATLDAANGIRPLALTWNGTAVNEYVTALTSGMAGTPNVVLDATAATGLNNTAINSLTLANSSSVGINAGQTLTLDSGGVLVTADAGITGGTLNAGAAGRQYLFHVLNPAVGGTTLTLTSTLATDTDFVKAGGGTVLFNTRQLRNATKWRSTIRGTVVK